MLVAPDQALQIARLLSFLMQGERLAHDCARTQANLATDPGMRHFFLAQARQEGLHAKVFQQGILWLTPKGARQPSVLGPMNHYRELLEKALRRAEFAETLLAQQVILERLGEVILDRVNYGMTQRGLGFKRLRRMLLNQEHAHHVFGLRCLERLVAADMTLQQRLRERGAQYLHLADVMFEQTQDLFAFFDEDPAVYAADTRKNLPQWLLEQR